MNHFRKKTSLLLESSDAASSIGDDSSDMIPAGKNMDARKESLWDSKELSDVLPPGAAKLLSMK